MADYRMEDIRSFLICGHGKCGKTSIADNILFKTGAVNRLGNVEDGTSVSDFTDEEKERQVSISSGVLNCMYKKKKFNIVDTPGYTDFFGDSIASFNAVNFAVLVIDAGSGVQINTRRSWEYAAQNNLPIIVVVNKTDGENLVVADIVKKIQEALSPKCVPVNYPDATGAEFSSVANLLDKSVELEGDAADIQAGLLENIIEADEALLERYLEEENVELQEIIPLLKTAIIEKSVVPILFTSAAKSLGIEELLDFIADFGIASGEAAPKPLYKKAAKVEKTRKADDAEEGEKAEEGEGAQEAEEAEEAEEAQGLEEVEYKVGPNEPFKGRVFKVLTDPYVGKLSFISIISGTAKDGLPVNFTGGRKPVNLTQLMMIQGSSQEPLAQALPGDIVAVAKIDEFKIGDTLLEKDKDLSFAPVDFPSPMVSLAVFSTKRGDEQKIGPSLRTFASEDPLFNVAMVDQTSEMVINGMGILHLESILSRMKKRFNIEVETRLPKIPYKETVTGSSDVKYKHKKQTGGHGQYGEVFIKVEPTDRGQGFEFVDEISGGVIPKQYIPAVEKGIAESMKLGILASCTIVDVRVRLYFGSFHAVDSSEMAFKTAASKAFRDGFLKAKPVLLEPIAEVDIMVPTQFMGNITGDISGRRGRMLGMDSQGDLQVVKAAIPEAELQTYSTELRSATGGEGTFTKTFSHYEVVPAQIAEKIIAKYKREEEED